MLTSNSFFTNDEKRCSVSVVCESTPMRDGKSAGSGPGSSFGGTITTLPPAQPSTPRISLWLGSPKTTSP